MEGPPIEWIVIQGRIFRDTRIKKMPNCEIRTESSN